MHLEKTFEDCASKADLDFATIKACHDDADQAWELQQQFAEMTPSDHEYTPWVLIDNVLFEGDDFMGAVCDAFKGTKPAACLKNAGAEAMCPADTTECHYAASPDVGCCTKAEVCMAVVGCR
jgi:hypothetical protein